MKGVERRFRRKIDMTPGYGPEGKCWEWTGARCSFGYGSFRVGDKIDGAHRVAYELDVGPIPKGLWVCHTCDNPPCVNPKHLFLGTRADNHGDMCAKNRQTKPKGETNAAHKLTDDEVRFIRKTALGPTALAEMFGVHRSTIHNVRSRQTWSHLSEMENDKS